jgi:hypothetical protein
MSEAVGDERKTGWMLKRWRRRCGLHLLGSGSGGGREDLCGYVFGDNDVAAVVVVVFDYDFSTPGYYSLLSLVHHGDSQVQGRYKKDTHIHIHPA